MPDTYLIIVLVLFALAILDLVVGVSNDAVNFLNSAIGSRVAPRHLILIVASLGIFIGAGFSNGMMEVARKGIFNPEHFYFEEIMIIFAAVMLTDIILLDLFNTFGLPTSTTVSIVFELLGAAVVVSLIKISAAGESLTMLSEYINTSKALAIISGIFLSIAVAFTVGMVIQYLSRLLFSFQFEKRMKFVGAIWSGFALSMLTYFLLIKGMKGAAFISKDTMSWVLEHTWMLLAVSFVAWTVILQVLMTVFRVNILRIIVLFGTFALAMAFAGNDLVNFIGVPLAGFDAFMDWSGSGVAADQLSMGSLAQPVETHSGFLLIAGVVMVLALVFSRKARSVTETEVNLGRQDEGAERFEPNSLSRSIVRSAREVGRATISVLPNAWLNMAERNFKKIRIEPQTGKDYDPPAFDLVRASVNLTVASMLISLATSYKLPLSTTYVSFMVAMGTSLADRAWGRDSAVYRVAGVLNVIAGWFFTAFMAFTAAGTFALLLHFFGTWALVGLLALAGFLIYRSFRYHREKEAEKEKEASLSRRKARKLSREAVRQQTRKLVAESLDGLKTAYRDGIEGLLNEDRDQLKKARKDIKALKKHNERLRGQLFQLIQAVDPKANGASRLYLLVYDLDQDLLQSTTFVVKSCVQHVENLHSPLTPLQADYLWEMEAAMSAYWERVLFMVKKGDFSQYETLMQERQQLLNRLEELLAEQVVGVQEGTYGSKNSLLYFSILLESKDLVTIAGRFVNLYYHLPKSPQVLEAEKVI